MGDDRTRRRRRGRWDVGRGCPRALGEWLCSLPRKIFDFGSQAYFDANWMRFVQFTKSWLKCRSHCQNKRWKRSLYVSTLKQKNTGHAGHIITKLSRWIVHDKSWSRILFQVKRLNVKVGVSLHPSECQSRACFVSTLK